MQWLRQAWLAVEERSLEVLAAWARRFSPRWRQMSPHLVSGLRGELAALFYLRRQGYTVVTRRWSSGEDSGDLDLVAWHGATLCFVEVKTRSGQDISPAESSIDHAKQNTLRRLARAYMRHLPPDAVSQVRFDVVSVYLLPGRRRQFQHMRNAFPLSASRVDSFQKQ